MTSRSDGFGEPNLERLLPYVGGSKFKLVVLAARRSRELTSYFNQLGSPLVGAVPPQVASVARKPLSIAFEEIAAGLIRLGQQRPELVDIARSIVLGEPIVVYLQSSDEEQLSSLVRSLDRAALISGGHLEVTELVRGSLRALLSPYESRNLDEKQRAGLDLATTVEPTEGIDPPEAVELGQAANEICQRVQQLHGAAIIFNRTSLVVRTEDGTLHLFPVPAASRANVEACLTVGDIDGLLAAMGA